MGIDEVGIDKVGIDIVGITHNIYITKITQLITSSSYSSFSALAHLIHKCIPHVVIMVEGLTPLPYPL